MPKYVILGVQHLFAMFGATVLVPVLTGLSVSSTLLFAGIGTLVFHLVSKLQVPAFLGSSFAFLGGYMSVKALGVEQGMSETLALDYACIGVFFAGLCYFVMAGLIKSFGVEKMLRFFPPLVTGPMIIAIGLVLSGSAIQNCTTNWPLAIVALHHQDYSYPARRGGELSDGRGDGRGGFLVAERGCMDWTAIHQRADRPGRV